MMRARALPVALAAILFASACSDSGQPPVASEPALADSADQIMSVVRVALHNEGIQRGRLIADTAYVFDESTRFEMMGVHVTFYTPTGVQNGTLTSLEGTYNTRLGTMEARGDVVVTNPDGRRLETEQLRYSPSANEISSDSAFVATEPDGRRIEGIGFDADPDLSNIRIRRTTGGTAGPVTLPGQ